MIDVSPEARELLTVVQEFCEKEVLPRAREIEDGTAIYDTELLHTAAAIGLQSLIVDERGAVDPEGFVLAHETNEIIASYSGSFALALSIARLHAYMLCSYANPEVRDQWLPGLLAGTGFGAFAISEPHAGTDVRAITTVARRDGDDYVLDGEKSWITQGPRAEFAVVLAKLDHRGRDAETAAFVVDLAAEGASAGPAEPLIGFRGVPLGTLNFSGVRVPAVARMNVEGFSGMLEGVNLARLDCASYALGFIRGALRECSTYLGEREAFGGPLSRNPLLQAQLGSMLAAYLSGRNLTHAALESFAAGGGGDNTLVSAAKLTTTEAAMAQSTVAVQLLGGSGVHTDYLVQSYFRDSKIIQIIDGTSQIHQLMLGRTVSRIDWTAPVPALRGIR
ncbi:acyl-CoA dehydrogenase family protein [Saccharopolyspora spinosa]|uniref:Alkylation response protein AidB-like acyl-CoA dehydrogenase n=1 Tax=Saccharopolyspora spinosa TaxID=60894 RepID=A0A2N3XY20_SACSN|nr:acyl-CoA dehydrogenase family protein [Saccharopolyspora spinosa]PKW15548.1 alkylation response protein AidB-like acyl-CoA dehydrogenase [Saccharopolyspora spinosa]